MACLMRQAAPDTQELSGTDPGIRLPPIDENHNTQTQEIAVRFATVHGPHVRAGEYMGGLDVKNEIIEKAAGRGWTNQQLADASGVPVSTVAAIRSKTNTRLPSYDTALRLLEALDKEDQQNSREEMDMQVTDEKTKNELRGIIINVYDRVIRDKNRLIAALLAIIVLLMSVIIVFTAYDVMHAGVGWVP